MLRSPMPPARDVGMTTDAGSVPQSLRLCPRVFASIRAAAAEGADQERGGLIAGRRAVPSWTILRFVRLANTAADQRRHFRFSAVDFARAVGDCERDGLEFLGFVHSHPNGPQTPSATDRREAWRGCVHGIVGPDNGSANAVAFYWCTHEHMHPLPLSIDARELSA